MLNANLFYRAGVQQHTTLDQDFLGSDRYLGVKLTRLDIALPGTIFTCMNKIFVGAAFIQSLCWGKYHPP